jgi:tetratricopeptide (TPR) repeat protein
MTNNGIANSNSSSVINAYITAKNLIDENKPLLASQILESYLKTSRTNADSAWFALALCYTMLHQYNDALNAYRKVLDNSNNRAIIETSAHRINKLLFVKLKNYDVADQGFSRYLITYPHGIWRDEAMYYYIELVLFKKNVSKADSLNRQYVIEFPRNCHAKELAQKIKTLQR